MRMVRIVVNLILWVPGLLWRIFSYIFLIGPSTQWGKTWVWEQKGVVNEARFPSLRPGSEVDACDDRGYWVPAVLVDAREMAGRYYVDIKTDTGQFIRNIFAERIRPRTTKINDLVDLMNELQEADSAYLKTNIYRYLGEHRIVESQTHMIREILKNCPKMKPFRGKLGIESLITEDPH